MYIIGIPQREKNQIIKPLLSVRERTAMNFKEGAWNKEVNVRDFIQRNYTPYDGGKEFLAPPTDRTRNLWNKLLEMMKEERRRNCVYDIDEKTISTITSHEAGYIDRDLEQIVGLQTDAPLKRRSCRSAGSV